MKTRSSDTDIGFDGFRLMVSDISEELSTAENLRTKGPASRLAAASEPAPLPRRVRSSRVNWPLIALVGGGATALVLWMNASGNSAYTTDPSYPVSDTRQAPNYDAPPEPGVESPSADLSPSPVTAIAPTDMATPVTGEVRPGPASGAVLGRGEIEYCLAENIRIDSSQPLVDDTSADQVSRFNAQVDDFNSRCSNFRYLESDMTAAKSAIELRRSALQQEGLSRFP